MFNSKFSLSDYIKSKLQDFVFASKRREKPNMLNNHYSYLYNPSEPVWATRDYHKFADEAYRKNVIAYRAINMITQGAASVPWVLYQVGKNGMKELKHHNLLTLLQQPNPIYAGAEFFENIYAYRMISGNAFILALGPEHLPPKELHILRPDRVSIIEGKSGMPAAYCYSVSEQHKKTYPVDNITGKSRILHIRNFHPLNDWYGMSPAEAAAYSIDQHNQAAMWNQSLLQNGARPGGAIIVKNDNYGGSGMLSEEQYYRLKSEIDEQFCGPVNAGRPLLFEGGLDWKEMSMSPKDMDFIEAKNSAARDIALAFGVPPQLLGLPGDNKYSNMQEARLALWEETILPLLDHMADALNHWLIPMFGKDLRLSYNRDEISALSTRRENIWSRIENCSFMTINEKREMIGLAPIAGGNTL